METLPDYLAPGLRLLSVGLNPSLPSVDAGFYFANPRNRFWPALNASVLLAAPVKPGPRAERTLLGRDRIGFTDLVKRPTSGASELRADDFRAGTARLEACIGEYRPGCVWFHGKVAYRSFLWHSEREVGDVDWGVQPGAIAGCSVFVTPNPSPANAAYSLEYLIAWYDNLAAAIT